MISIYQEILKSKAENQKLLAILIDPDKVVFDNLEILILKINQSPATHIFVGGSTVNPIDLHKVIDFIKQKTTLPIVLFPGDYKQISENANAILFLSLLSGRNPDYLIEHHVKSALLLKKMNLEIIPTAYILIESGNETAVAKVSKTKPLDRENQELILATAIAGEMLGNKIIYLEAGSGAKFSVPKNVVKLVSENTQIPLIVGGGIRSFDEINEMYNFGADLVVISRKKYNW